MLDKNKATPPGSQINKKTQSNCNHISHTGSTIKPATQLERVLLALLYNESLNCQEAEKYPIKARHLNSVISELAHYHGLEINRQREKAPGYHGEICYLIRYSVYPHQQAKARQLIDQWRAKRNAAQIAWLNLKAASLDKHLRTA
ncbi:MAG: hypothetical protein NWQ54_10865 [Paraglaciecola sp.]|nr:hypothetical protein [Paraglaciecola sp.]